MVSSHTRSNQYSAKELRGPCTNLQNYFNMMFSTLSELSPFQYSVPHILVILSYLNSKLSPQLRDPSTLFEFPFPWLCSSYFLQAICWNTHRTNLICFPSLRNYDLVLLFVKCLIYIYMIVFRYLRLHHKSCYCYFIMAVNRSSCGLLEW